jgi:prophage regulatory protein
MRNDATSPITLLRCKAVQERTGLKRSALYKAMSNGDFPTPVKISAKAVAWPSNEVDIWISNRIASSKQANSLDHSTAPTRGSSRGGKSC